MMERIIFALPGNEQMAGNIAEKTGAEPGELIIRAFPDAETYVRVISVVSGKEVILVCSLNAPDTKLLSLYFLSKNLKDLGAKKVILVAPYLAYMRQDKLFKPGEAITSEYFGELVSSFADELITIDPHLHRKSNMAELYSIPCKVLHASVLISHYIKSSIEHPLIIGPDSESEQWVSIVARDAGAPYIVLQKERFGDEDVKIVLPLVEKYRNHTPVLVDDIISTAHTMIEAIEQLKSAGMKSPVCIGVHAIFAGSAFKDLQRSGAADVITCNTIVHPSNRIDISELLCVELLVRNDL